jgi:hypothetical protein
MEQSEFDPTAKDRRRKHPPPKATKIFIQATVRKLG